MPPSAPSTRQKNFTHPDRVYTIVADMGGAIDVKSAPGEGSTFSIYIPMAEPTTAGVAAL
jgi:hypothetical protein